MSKNAKRGERAREKVSMTLTNDAISIKSTVLSIASLTTDRALSPAPNTRGLIAD